MRRRAIVVALALILAPFLMNQPLTFDYTNFWTLGLALLQEIRDLLAARR